MNTNSQVLILLCSHLCVENDIRPLEPREWSALAKKLMEEKLCPGDLLFFEKNCIAQRLHLDDETSKRYQRLLDRAGSMEFALSDYENMGIYPVTRADALYPKALKKKLGNSCPPLFYAAGNLDLLNTKTVGYVGARTVDEKDLRFTRETIGKTVRHGYGVVTGGARGIDSASSECALSEGAPVIEYLADSLLKKLRRSEYVKAIQNGRLLALSVAKPDAGFNVGMAMMRNRYIYAQSSGTVIVHSDLNKGGTWTGATENLQKNWCPSFCWDYPYPGNQELIKRGAFPIKDNWNGNVSSENGNENCKQMEFL